MNKNKKKTTTIETHQNNAAHQKKSKWQQQQHIGELNMGSDARKPVFGVCNQVIPKPACSATETS